MADTRLELGCFIKGDFTPILVKAPRNARIFVLKSLIWEQRKQSTLRGCNAKDMILWKVGAEQLADSSKLISTRSLQYQYPYHLHIFLSAFRH